MQAASSLDADNVIQAWLLADLHHAEHLRNAVSGCNSSCFDVVAAVFEHPLFVAFLSTIASAFWEILAFDPAALS